MNIGKYEFNSKEQAESKIAAFDTEGNNHSFVKLGFALIEEPTYDDEGNLLTGPVFNDKYMVDVAWEYLADEDGNVDHPFGWKSYAVDVEDEGIHSFYGLKYQDLKI